MDIEAAGLPARRGHYAGARARALTYGILWHNDKSHHVVGDFASFHNRTGIEHGSYWTSFTSIACSLPPTASGSCYTPSHQELRRISLAYREGRIYDGVSIVNHRVPASGVATIYNSTVSHVTVDESTGGATRYDLVNCTKDDVSSLSPRISSFGT